jgi:hypothetical protein
VILDRARQWMADVHPHARHLERTLDWLLVLDPDASEAARIAAATHDVERAYPDGNVAWDSARDWDSAEYNRWHQDRCADMIGPGLLERGASEELAREVAGLVRVHEDGGWLEADLVQAADSLSFLETMVPLVVGWIESGRAPRERAEGKLRHSVERISPDLPRAKEIAEALLAPALSRLRAANDPAQVRALLGLARTGRMYRLARDRFP